MTLSVEINKASDRLETLIISTNDACKFLQALTYKTEQS